MIIYVAHKYGGGYKNFESQTEFCKALAKEYPQHTFISPLHAFSYLDYGEIGYEHEMQICEDLLTICDCLLVVSEISNGVKREIELAKKIKNANGEPMPIIFIPDGNIYNIDFGG